MKIMKTSFKIPIIFFFFISCSVYAYEGSDHERMNRYICENPRKNRGHRKNRVKNRGQVSTIDKKRCCCYCLCYSELIWR